MDKEKQTHEKFMKIMDSKDLKQLDEFVKRHGVNYKINGATILYWAVYFNNVLVVSRLLELGANPDFRNELGTSCLSLACYFGFVEILKTLISYGAKIDTDCIHRAKHGWGGHVQEEILSVLQKHL